MGKAYRVVICGMKSVGKTTILEQAIYGHIKNNSIPYPTIEDIYVANVETDRGSKEQIRFYDTKGIDPALSPMSPSGDQSRMMLACGQLARQYNGGIIDAYILVYDVSRSDSLDCVMTMKREIEKMRDKKEAFYVIIGNHTSWSENDPAIVVNKAAQWCMKEKLRHFEVNAKSRQTLYESFVYLASKISSTPNKSTFPQLNVVRKSVKSESG